MEIGAVTCLGECDEYEVDGTDTVGPDNDEEKGAL